MMYDSLLYIRYTLQFICQFFVSMTQNLFFFEKKKVVITYKYDSDIFSDRKNDLIRISVVHSIEISSHITDTYFNCDCLFVMSWKSSSFPLLLK